MLWQHAVLAPVVTRAAIAEFVLFRAAEMEVARQEVAAAVLRVAEGDTLVLVAPVAARTPVLPQTRAVVVVVVVPLWVQEGFQQEKGDDAERQEKPADSRVEAVLLVRLEEEVKALGQHEREGRADAEPRPERRYFVHPANFDKSQRQESGHQRREEEDGRDDEKPLPLARVVARDPVRRRRRRACCPLRLRLHGVPLLGGLRPPSANRTAAPLPTPPNSSRPGAKQASSRKESHASKTRRKQD
mmetsp:Transcript_17489/g.35705  ORF Transcript_17489/g.35705 Transcript_17489/m.35705 type:complete len:244 (-) Transcript_17489:67-798(-)